MFKKFRAPLFVTLLFSFWVPVVGWLSTRLGVSEGWWTLMLVVQGTVMFITWAVAAEDKQP